MLQGVGAGLIGGISAGMISPRAITLLVARWVLSAVLVAEVLLIATASLAGLLSGYLVVAAALGCLGWDSVGARGCRAGAGRRPQAAR